MTKTISKKNKCKKAKWLSEEALQISEERREEKSKGEKERYIQLNAEIQRIAKRAKKVKLKVVQSCPTLCDPMVYSVHGILQARILEWVAFPFSRGSSQPRDRTGVSCIAGDSLPTELWTFLNEDMKENNRITKTWTLLKKTEEIKRTFHAKLAL